MAASVDRTVSSIGAEDGMHICVYSEGQQCVRWLKRGIHAQKRVHRLF